MKVGGAGHDQAWPTCADRWQAFGALAWAQGMNAPRVTLGTIRHIAVDADAAHVVHPAGFSFGQRGRRIHERHATMTLALKKKTAGWRISAWNWAYP